jgi:hypothetical protein
VALLQDQSIEKMHTAFKELLDKREQVRTTEIKVPMRTSFKPTDKHEVDIHDHRAVAEMKKWPYRQILGHACHVDMHDTSRVLACESPGARTAFESPHRLSSRQPDGLRSLPHSRGQGMGHQIYRDLDERAPGFITGFCHSLKWASLSALSPEIKVLVKLSGIAVFALQQLEIE